MLRTIGRSLNNAVRAIVYPVIWVFRLLTSLLKQALYILLYPVIWVYRLIVGLLMKNILLISFVVILSLMAVGVLWKRVVIVIPAGYLGVLYAPLFGGIDLSTVFEEGVHFIFPVNTVTQYDARVQSTKISMEVLTKDQLKSKISVSFQYQISKYTLPLLHKYVGPEYFDKIILPEVTGKTRVLFADVSSQNAFTKELEQVVNGIAITADQVILEKLGPPGIDMVRLIRISSAQLESIEFPEEIQAAIRSKIAEGQKVEGYAFKVQSAKLEAERKVAEANGVKQYQDIVNAGLSENYLKLRGIEATLQLAESSNSKVIVFGSAPSGLPLLLGGDTASAAASPTTTSNPTTKASAAPAASATTTTTAPATTATTATPATGAQK